jgi:adenylate kinase
MKNYSMKGMHILIMGPQGSGKGTEAHFLHNDFGYPRVVAGDVLRAHVEAQTLIGQSIKGIIEQGKLIDDEIIKEVIAEEMSLIDTREGFIIDGYPRTLQQAKDLEDITPIDVVVYLVIDGQTSVRRLGNRRQCALGHVFNIVTNPPQQEGVCDYDEESLFIREDDQPEAIQRRLEIFTQETKPVLEYYKAQGKVLEIDGSGSPAEVHEKVKEALQKFNV